jgi:hypothetical protein
MGLFVAKTRPSTSTLAKNFMSIHPSDQWVLLAKQIDFLKDKVQNLWSK